MRFSAAILLFVFTTLISAYPALPLVSRVGGAGIGGGVGGGVGFGGNGQGQAASDPTIYESPDSTPAGQATASNSTAPSPTTPAPSTGMEPFVRFLTPSLSPTG
jgi:hypothetical protein